MIKKPAHTPRTPDAEAALRAAHRRMYALLSDPVACMSFFAPHFLAFAKPEERVGVLQELRALCRSEPDRVALVLHAYQGALRLYDAGALDAPAA